MIITGYGQQMDSNAFAFTIFGDLIVFCSVRWIKSLAGDENRLFLLSPFLWLLLKAKRGYTSGVNELA